MEKDSRTRALLACGVVSGPLFVLVFLIEGATREGYEPLRHPVSSLELGPMGWMQSLNFIVAGLLSLAFALGLRQALGSRTSLWGPLLVGVWAISLLAAGLFTTDPVSGYPPGTPALIPYTWHGALHDLLSLPGFLALPAACFLFGFQFARQRRRGWAAYSILSGLVFAGAFVLASAGFAQTGDLVNLAGLFQRIAVLAGFGWLGLLGIVLLGSPAEKGTPPGS
jgi:hypothetical protein